jgi:hypothetical protein
MKCVCASLEHSDTLMLRGVDDVRSHRVNTRPTKAVHRRGLASRNNGGLARIDSQTRAGSIALARSLLSGIAILPTAAEDFSTVTRRIRAAASAMETNHLKQATVFLVGLVVPAPSWKGQRTAGCIGYACTINDPQTSERLGTGRSRLLALSVYLAQGPALVMLRSCPRQTRSVFRSDGASGQRFFVR